MDRLNLLQVRWVGVLSWSGLCLGCSAIGRRPCHRSLPTTPAAYLMLHLALCKLMLHACAGARLFGPAHSVPNSSWQHSRDAWS